jgi:hypothetical protein
MELSIRSVTGGWQLVSGEEKRPVSAPEAKNKFFSRLEIDFLLTTKGLHGFLIELSRLEIRHGGMLCEPRHRRRARGRRAVTVRIFCKTQPAFYQFVI